MKTQITIIYETPEITYDPFDVEITWTRTASKAWEIEEWDFATDNDKSQCKKIVADGNSEDDVWAFIESEVNDADYPE